MKTKTLNLKQAGKKLMYALILIVGIGIGNIASACTANFTYTTGANGLVNFTSTSNGFNIGAYYDWNPGDGSPNLNGATPSHTYHFNGTYYVLLLVSDSNCTDTITLPVVVTNAINCSLSASYNVSYGSHGAVTFTSTSVVNSNTVYFWDPGDGSGRVSGTNVFNHTYIYKGNYTAWLTIQDTTSLLCIDSVANIVSDTNADSNAIGCNLHVSYTYTLGLNGHVSFTSTSTGVQPGSTLNWNPGDGSPVTSNPDNIITYNHIYLANGTYNVQLLINGDSGNFCMDSITVPINITNVTQPCILSANFNITYDSSGQVTLTSTSTGTNANTLYFWNPGDGSPTQQGSSVFVYNYPFIGDYNPTLIVEDTGAGFCIDSISLPIYVYNKDSLQASFVYVADSLNSGTYIFTSTSLGTNVNTYYKWNPGDGSPADSGLVMTTYTHHYNSNGPYNASLTIWYTIIPRVLHHNAERIGMIHYDESYYQTVVNVTTVVTGIASVQDASDNFTLYPNPSSGQFRLSLGNLTDEKAEVEISNVLGELVYKTTAETSASKLVKDINMQNASAGLYFVRVITADKVYTSKLVIGR